jgi:hypothetical protein
MQTNSPHPAVNRIEQSPLHIVPFLSVFLIRGEYSSFYTLLALQEDCDCDTAAACELGDATVAREANDECVVTCSAAW